MPHSKHPPRARAPRGAIRRTAAAGTRPAATRIAAKGPSRIRELDADALLHELRVHQVELEVQNEELRRSRSEMELALQLFTEIFDFSPVGYAVVQADSAITDVNHAAAQMLGRARATLCGVHFERLVTHDYRPAFQQLLISAQSSSDKQSCALKLLLLSGESRETRLTVTALMRPQPTMLVAFDCIDR